MTDQVSPLEPTRDPRVTLPDLIEVLLNRGVILHLDLIVAVADIPLIGVSLKAAIAGIETMLEYGMMRQWDESTRAWVQRSISRSVPFGEGEELIARMPGGQEQSGLYTAWRPGTLYLTDRRLFVFRREPREMLWEAQLHSIEAVELEPERSVGGEDRMRLRVLLTNGDTTRLSAAEPERMQRLVREQAGRLGLALGGKGAGSESVSEVLREEMVWYQEPRSAGPVWRRGVGRLDRRAGLTWKSVLDARPAVALEPGQIRGIHMEGGDAPGGSRVLVLATASGRIRLASENIREWAEALLDLLEDEAGPGTEVRHGADG